MRIISFFILLLSSFTLFGQIENPVSWTTSVKKLSADEYELTWTAKLDEGWNTYSQYLASDDGPVRTSFHYDKASHYQLVGKNSEDGHRKEGFDKMFDMNVIKFSESVTFKQKIKVSDASKPIKGYVEYMCCNDEKCLPPTEFNFSFSLPAGGEEKKKINEPTPVQGKTKDAKSSGSEPKADAPAPGGVVPAPLEIRDPSQVIAPSGETNAGLLDPVKWKAQVKKIEGDTYLLELVGTPDPGWHMYSQYTDPNGPIPTEVTFKDAAHFKKIGKVEEKGKLIEGADPLFDNAIVKTIDGAVVFSQKISASNPNEAITGDVYFMACNDKTCTPPTQVDFRFVPADGVAQIGAELSSNTATGAQPVFALPKPNLAVTVGQCGNDGEVITEKTSYLRIFFLGFLGGLLALLTPCVFPMIPLTVSFFTKRHENKSKGVFQSLMYGFFILLVYLLLSVPFHLLDNLNPDILNDISTNVWLNIFFFVVFVVFAFSFFGYYELTLPEKWTNSSARAENASGLLGVFFMALTLALVSFSCTGPILGSLLAGALTTNGGAMQLTAGMGGFGLALALPFALFAMFPGWLKALPKSGSWMNTVKVVFGFLELALAFKFLSNADLVKHWEALAIEPFLLIWILIFLGLALYLFGLFYFPHYGKERRSGGKMAIGALSLAFAVYLGTGFLVNENTGHYRQLKLLSGLTPPVTYSWFRPGDCPHNLNCFKDLQEGMAYAKQVGKPVMIDFTGHACVNCRKMEEHVWPTSPVFPYLQKDYVLISLYVDDKRELPAEQQVEVPTGLGGTRKLRTIGNKWSHLQTEYFQTNTQPYYVLIDTEGNLLTKPRGYTPVDQEYADFLRCGKEAFEGKKKGVLGVR
jgi:thiol:disulfide interchange protein